MNDEIDPAISAITHPGDESESHPHRSPDCLALVIAWSSSEPDRVGEVGLIHPDQPRWIFGRCPPPNSGGKSLTFFRSRPLQVRDAQDEESAKPYLKGEAISRRQLVIHPLDDALHVANVGQCTLSVNGQIVTEATIHPGDTLFLHNQLLLYCTRRPVAQRPLRAYPGERVGGFGEADADGMVGESPLLWRLRDRLAACARTCFHVLVLGESGCGKELAAQAIHNLSDRASHPLIVHNIAAIPPELATALLFGNKRNFPNPGMDEHPGLIGAAHGSSLFLDEIGDMPETVQPLFLRVTERGGEYFRLGESSHPRHSDFRLIGATNHPMQLRYELKRRFQREVLVPGLNERKEDIPLLVRHILNQQASGEDFDVRRFLSDGRPRVHPRLIEQLLHRSYTTHVSEIAFLLGTAMSQCDGDVIRPLGPEFIEDPANEVGAQTTAQRSSPRPLPSPLRARAALDESGGDITRAAAALDISRDQLNRLIRRERLVVPRTRRPAPQRSEPSC